MAAKLNWGTMPRAKARENNLLFIQVSFSGYVEFISEL
jgi:hypothetical protein